MRKQLKFNPGLYIFEYSDPLTDPLSKEPMTLHVMALDEMEAVDRLQCMISTWYDSLDSGVEEPEICSIRLISVNGRPPKKG